MSWRHPVPRATITTQPRAIAHCRIEEATVGFVVAGASLVLFFVAERAVALVRKSKFDKRRATADYPVTGNDPQGRIVV
jgi:hypothetical protein